MCVLDKTQGVMKHRLFLILLMWCLFSKSCLGIFMWLMFRTSDSIYTVGSHTVSEYLLKNLLTPCHEVSPVMLSGFEHVCFTLTLKIGFYHGARLSFFFFFLMRHIQYALIIFSAVVIAVFVWHIVVFVFYIRGMRLTGRPSQVWSRLSRSWSRALWSANVWGKNWPKQRLSSRPLLKSKCTTCC